MQRLIGQSWASDYRERVLPVCIDHRVQILRYVFDGFIPGSWNQATTFLVADQRRANSLFVVNKWVAKPSLDTEELAVQAVDIAITGNNAHELIGERAK